MNNFDACLAHVLQSEGGYVNNPADPGGETNLGVTRKVWEDWVKRELFDDEMRHLTPEMVGPLYKAKYWDAICGDSLPAGVDLCVFDCAVNGGVSRAARFIQHSAGAVEDGEIGHDTLELIKSRSPVALIRDFCAQREMHYKSLPTFADFGKGWMSRLDRVEEDAIKMTL
jgi:lysozyme family protein